MISYSNCSSSTTNEPSCLRDMKMDWVWVTLKHSTTIIKRCLIMAGNANPGNKDVFTTSVVVLVHLVHMDCNC